MMTNEEREEELRQVEGECGCAAGDCYILLHRVYDHIARNEIKHIVGTVRDLCVASRILAREQAALAELKKGWKA
jgi:hypothetical protein